MGVLGSEEIRARLDEIFTRKSWSEDCIQEAAYDLRVASDILLVGGEFYEEGNPFKPKVFEIKPGEIAWISTKETFSFPSNIVGHIGIKFKLSRKGLTPLFGFQVDPYYGHGQINERLYLAVSNIGPEPIQIEIGQPVFVLEFHTVEGEVRHIHKPRGYVGDEIQKDAYKLRPRPELGFLRTIKDEMRQEFRQDYGNRLDRVEHGTQQVVFFGIFLVAATILAGSITALFAMIFSIDSGDQSGLAGSLVTPSVRTLLFSVALFLAIATAILFSVVLAYLFVSLRVIVRSRGNR